MGKIFISYRRKDSDFAHRLAERLQEQIDGAVFIDLKINKDDYAVALEDEVKQCNVLALLVTENTFASERIQHLDDWIRREVALALEMQKPIVLVLREGQPLPLPDFLPENIRRIVTKQGVPIYLSFYDEGIATLARHCVAISNGGLRLRTDTPSPEQPSVQQTLHGTGFQVAGDVNGTIDMGDQYVTNLDQRVTNQHQHGQKQYWMKMEAPVVSSDPHFQSQINQAYDMGNQLANNTALNEGTRSLAWAFAKVAFSTYFLCWGSWSIPFLRTRMDPQVIKFHQGRLRKIARGWVVISCFGVLMPALFFAGLFGIAITSLARLMLAKQEQRVLRLLKDSNSDITLPVYGNGYGWLAFRFKDAPVRWTLIQDILVYSIPTLGIGLLSGNITNGLSTLGLLSIFAIAYIWYYQHKFGPWLPQDAT